MRKAILSKLTIIMYIISIVSTVTVLGIVYFKIEGVNAYRFVVGYVFYLIAFILYLILVAAMRQKKAGWLDLRKRLVKFLLGFASLSIFLYLMQFLFKSPSKGLAQDLVLPLGSAFGAAFFDLIFYEKEEDNNE